MHKGDRTSTTRFGGETLEGNEPAAARQNARRPAPLRGAGDLRLAIVVDPSLPPGLLANTVAVVAAGLGAACPGIAGVPMADADGRGFLNSADRPIPVLQADAAGLAALLARLGEPPADAAVVPFPAFARALHAFSDYADVLPTRRLAEERLEGIGLAGPSRWVRSLTGSLKLLR
jgi:hypothetical protein